MEKSIYSSIESKTLLIAVMLCIIALIITRNPKVALGFIIGSGARMIGFLSIIRASRLMEGSNRPNMAAGLLYVVRFGFYGGVIAISLMKGINIFSLLAGFLILNMVIMLTQGKVRREA